MRVGWLRVPWRRRGFARLMCAMTVILAAPVAGSLPSTALAECTVDTFAIPGLTLAGDLTEGLDGNIWITQPDIYSNSIAVVGTDGTLLHSYAIPTPRAFTWGIVTASDGNLWFLETDGNRVGRITLSGEITEFPLPTPDAHAQAITAGPDGNLWLTEGYPNKIARVTTQGVFTEFQLPAGTFPSGITAGPGGTVWFTEYYKDSIGRINVDGSGFQDYKINTPDGFMAGLESIAQGSDGNLYFNEWLGRRIGRITPAGDVAQYDLPASLYQPHRVTLGADGNIWFSAGSVGSITPAGEVTSYPGPRPGFNIGAAADGSIWFSPTGGPGNLAHLSGC
jgi:virginiamycin B lyase